MTLMMMVMTMTMTMRATQKVNYGWTRHDDDEYDEDDENY